MLKICNRCSKLYKANNKNRKYCGTYCSNMNNRKGERTEPRKPRKKETKKRKPKVKKKYFCSICSTAEVKVKANYCKRCRNTRNKIKTFCKICGMEILSFKSRVRKYCSQECKFKGFIGEGNPNYIDGRNPENKRIRNSKEYKAWRVAVFTRDKYTCRHCGQIGYDLHADHIKPFSQFPELRLELSNGRTLCVECHKKTPTWMSGSRKKKT